MTRLRFTRPKYSCDDNDLSLSQGTTSFNYQQTITFEAPIILLPGDELLDCWTNSSSRNFVTIGSESTSEEMCQAHLWYYPAIDLYRALSQKTPSAMGSWMKDAQQAGYLNGTSDDIDEIFDSGDDSQFGPFDFGALYYDTTIDGADEFYDRLYSVDYEKYNKHMYWCYYFDGDEYVLYNSEFMNISRSEDFIEYDLSVGNCTSTENDEDVSGVCVAGEYTPSPIEDSDPSNEGGFTANLCMVWITSLILIVML